MSTEDYKVPGVDVYEAPPNIAPPKSNDLVWITDDSVVEPAEPLVKTLDELPVISTATMMENGKIVEKTFNKPEPKKPVNTDSIEQSANEWTNKVDQNGQTYFTNTAVTETFKDKWGDEIDTPKKFYPNNPEHRQELEKHGVKI